TGGDLTRDMTPCTSIPFLSAPPHGGRPSAAPMRNHAPMVSIRAPARGATSKDEQSMFLRLKFLSAPPHGGRPLVPPQTYGPSCFYPRPRTGGDYLVQFLPGMDDGFY